GWGGGGGGGGVGGGGGGGVGGARGWRASGVGTRPATGSVRVAGAAWASVKAGRPATTRKAGIRNAQDRHSGGKGRERIGAYSGASTRSAKSSSMPVAGKSAKPSIRSVAPAAAYSATRARTASAVPARADTTRPS